MLGTPILWAVQLLLMYALVPYVCHHGHTWLLYATTLAFVGLAALVGYLAFVSWKRSGAEIENMDTGDSLARSRFMAMLGVLSAIIFGMLIVWQGIPSLILDPCSQ
jgi:hypothetical protein